MSSFASQTIGRAERSFKDGGIAAVEQPARRSFVTAEDLNRESIMVDPVVHAGNHAHSREDAVSARRERRQARATAWPTVSVIIPTLNEAQNLPLVLAELPSDGYEVIIVDGLSTDGTPEIARQAMPDAKIVFQAGRGKGDALRCGFEAATGDILVMMDADGSADPAEIPRFVDALLDGADFAKGTRFLADGGSADITRLRMAGNRLLSGTVNTLFRTSYSDLCYGYNAFWRHCLAAISVDCTGFEIETQINIRVGRSNLYVREIPSFERQRIHGQSNLRTFRDGARVLRTIGRERMKRRSQLPTPRESGDSRRLAAELAAIGETR